MADEATVRCSLEITQGNLKYRSYPTDFTVDVAASKGPVPGAIAVGTAGTDIDFSELTTPGLCRISNLDATNYVEIGIWDGTEFYPVIELGPGEFYVIKLSRFLGKSFAVGSGTGTYDTDTYTLRARANVAACNILVEAFEI